MIALSRAAGAERACPCSVCRRRRRLESKLAVARDVLTGARPFVIGLDGVLFQDDTRDLEEMIADLNEAVEKLEHFDHRPRPRRRWRSTGRFMARSRSPARRFMERTWQL